MCVYMLTRGNTEHLALEVQARYRHTVSFLHGNIGGEFSLTIAH